MKKKVRIFLAWQTIADGRKQIRRWSPDINRFFGYEKKSVKSLTWLFNQGNPEWDKLTNNYPLTPYEEKEL